MLVNIVHTIDRQIIAALLEPLRQEFQLSDGQLGTLSGIAYAGAGVLPESLPECSQTFFASKTILSMALALWSAFTGPSLRRGDRILRAAASTDRRRRHLLSGSTLLSIHELSVSDSRRTARPVSPVNSMRAAQSATGLLLAFSLGTWIAAHFGWRMAFFAAASPALVLVPLLMVFLMTLAGA